jgi:hypothetical protein
VAAQDLEETTVDRSRLLVLEVYMGQQGEQAAGPQDGGRLRPAHPRVGPVERRRREERVEGGRGQLDIFERRDLEPHLAHARA